MITFCWGIHINIWKVLRCFSYTEYELIWVFNIVSLWILFITEIEMNKWWTVLGNCCECSLFAFQSPPAVQRFIPQNTKTSGSSPEREKYQRLKGGTSYFEGQERLKRKSSAQRWWWPPGMLCLHKHCLGLPWITDGDPLTYVKCPECPYHPILTPPYIPSLKIFNYILGPKGRISFVSSMGYHCFL